MEVANETMHVGYVLYKLYGFCVAKHLPLHLPPFLLQIVFKEDKCGMYAKLHFCTTSLCIDLSEILPLVRGKSVSMTLVD